jgi:hypothetical protein
VCSQPSLQHGSFGVDYDIFDRARQLPMRDAKRLYCSAIPLSDSPAASRRPRSSRGRDVDEAGAAESKTQGTSPSQQPGRVVAGRSEAASDTHQDGRFWAASAAGGHGFASAPVARLLWRAT